jgi:3-deoxy-D-manno-octulosonic acid kinase
MDRIPYRDDPALIDFNLIRGAGSRVLVRRGYEVYAPLMAPGGAAVASEVAEGVVPGGRRPHPIIVLPNGERVVIRAYRRGGAVAHLNRRYYFFGNRSLEELRATARAASAGVRVPEVIVAAEQRAGIGYTATLATRWIPAGEDGAAWLRGAAPAERELVLREAGRQIGLMHAAGIAHPDLNLRNLLIVAAPERADPLVYLLDFDRARLSAGPTPPARRARDLQRLGRSARKLALPLEEGDGWLALRVGYGAGWPLSDRGYRASASSTFSTT